MAAGSGETAAEGLRVWCADAAAAAPLLAALGCGAPLDALPEAPGEGPLLLLHRAPAAALAAALRDGQAPDAARAAWQAETRALLALHRAARRRVRLAELGAALADPGALCALVGRPAPETPFAEPETGGPDPILHLLAQRLILGDPALGALAAELEAASADLTGGAGLAGDDPDAAWRAHGALLRAGGEAETLKAQQAAAGQERDLLKAQNRAMMDELEALARQRQQLEERLAQTGQGLDSYQAQVATLERALEALRDRMARKEQSLQASGQMVQDLDARAARLKQDLARARAETAEQAARAAAAETQGAERAAALAAERDAARAATEALRGEIDRITASRSFRLTAPLRRMRALLGGRT